jgi:hypothetical protein
LELIGPRPFDPLLVSGRAIALLAAFEHREFTGGPYNEIALGLLAKRRGTAPSLTQFALHLRTLVDAAWLIVNLPVTTNIALVAGVELWCYPKYLADIRTDFRPDRVVVSLGSEFSLTHARGVGCSVKCPPLVTYSVLNERIIRTTIDCHHWIRFGGARRVRVDLHGRGPTSDSLRALGVADLRPMLAFRSDAERMVLPLGQEIGQALH